VALVVVVDLALALGKDQEAMELAHGTSTAGVVGEIIRGATVRGGWSSASAAVCEVTEPVTPQFSHLGFITKSLKYNTLRKRLTSRKLGVTATLRYLSYTQTLRLNLQHQTTTSTSNLIQLGIPQNNKSSRVSILG